MIDSILLDCGGAFPSLKDKPLEEKNVHEFKFLAGT
jgi:hypothetical protein